MTIQAERYNAGKPQLSYLLTFPHALEEVAYVCMKGAEKYERGNYLKGAPLSQYADCALRHLLKWQNGQDMDSESGNLHLAHAAWNILMLLEMSVSQPTRDDRINQSMWAPHINVVPSETLALHRKLYGRVTDDTDSEA